MGGGGGLGSPLAGFSPNTDISFLMISPNLLDICLVFLLVFSPLETADFLMSFKPLVDGYSLLCSQKAASAAQEIIFEAKLCCGSCFLSYTAEIRHHLTAKIISKEALS